MKRFYIRVFCAFALWLIVSLAAHFFSPDPWGASLSHTGEQAGDLILTPASSSELFVRSFILEMGFLVVICLGLSAVESLSSKAGWRYMWRGLSVVALSVYALFGHIDREVMRWMGEHMTWSFVRTYTNVSAINVTGDVLSGDAFWSRIMLIIAVLLAVPALVSLFLIRDTQRVPWSRRVLAVIALSGFLMASAQYVAPVKRRKLHHIDPGIARITRDALWDFLKLDHPKHPQQAEADLVAIARGNAHHAADDVGTNPAYPLWRDDNVGSLDRVQFANLPLQERPDVLLIVVETWRGWQTGLEHNPTFVGNPELRAILEQTGAYFPYTHSAGFPSTEGILGVHLGLWSDPERVFIIDHLSIRSRSLPEILRDAGYSTYALLGFDPAFDNLTPALTRWYERIEYDGALQDDEALVQRWLARYRARDRQKPAFMTLTTRTTHAPYHLPEHLVPADAQAPNSEVRYQQTLRYSDAQIAELIRTIQQSPDWDRTLIILVGDHAQPTPFQRDQQDLMGRFTPGNTWTTLALTGGWAERMPQGRHDFTASLVDIGPTVLKLLNLKSYHHFVGRDLVRAARDYASGDAERRARVTAWPVLSMNRGYIMWEQGDARAYFHLRNRWRIHVDFDRQDPLAYGQLHDLHAALTTDLPAAWTVDRWTDAIKAYRMLLKHDRLMPP